MRDKNRRKEYTTVAEQMTLGVTGMSCGGCEHAITRALSSLEGVSQVAASHRDSRVTLVYDPGLVDRDAIVKRIEAAGYEISPLSPR
jgi:copper chaperone